MGLGWIFAPRFFMNLLPRVLNILPRVLVKPRLAFHTAEVIGFAFIDALGGRLRHVRYLFLSYLAYARNHLLGCRGICRYAMVVTGIAHCSKPRNKHQGESPQYSKCCDTFF